MADLHHIKSRTPRKLHEVDWTEGGMRLSPVKRVTQSDWFWPAMVTLPLGAFVMVFFW